MAGLLEWMNSPAGVGLLSAAAGGMAGARKGTPWNNVGRGMVTGLGGYQGAQQQIRADEENAFAKQYKTLQMQELERKMAQTKAEQAWKAGLPGMMAPKLTGSTDQGRQLAEQQAEFGSEGLGELVGSAQYAATKERPNVPLNVDYGMDKQALQQYMMQPDSPYADDLIKQQYVPKPEEYGTTPFVDADGNAQLIGKTGATKTLPFKGAPKEGASPYGQDLREWFAVNGIDPRNATPQQLQAGYAYVNREKLTRAKAGGVNIGPTTVMAEGAADRAGKKIGDIVGEDTATIEGKYSALDSVQGAIKQLDEGIYSGYWANSKMGVAKATSGAIGDRDKAARTEKFKSYIGNTVIPRLKEFGGNDSVEELRMLERVMGGDITLEPEALAEILKQIEIKQLRSIDRARRNQSAIEGGGVPSTGPGPSREQEGKTGKSKSGRPIIYRNGQWEYQ